MPPSFLCKFVLKKLDKTLLITYHETIFFYLKWYAIANHQGGIPMLKRVKILTNSRNGNVQNAFRTSNPPIPQIHNADYGTILSNHNYFSWWSFISVGVQL